MGKNLFKISKMMREQRSDEYCSNVNKLCENSVQMNTVQTLTTIMGINYCKNAKLTQVFVISTDGKVS